MPPAQLDATDAGLVVALLRSLPGRGTTCLVATQEPDLARRVTPALDQRQQAGDRPSVAAEGGLEQRSRIG